MSLREANKKRLKEDVRRHALRLFEERGFEAVTVEQIATASDISPATFYRHFRNKEDVLFNEEYDPFLDEAFAHQPAEDPLAVVVRNVFLELAGKLFEADRAVLLLRHRLMTSVPALEERLVVEARANLKQLAALVARRTDRDPAEFEVVLAAATATTAFAEATRYWLDHDCEPSLTDLVEVALDRVASALAL